MDLLPVRICKKGIGWKGFLVQIILPKSFDWLGEGTAGAQDFIWLKIQYLSDSIPHVGSYIWRIRGWMIPVTVFRIHFWDIIHCYSGVHIRHQIHISGAWEKGLSGYLRVVVVALLFEGIIQWCDIMSSWIMIVRSLSQDWEWTQVYGVSPTILWKGPWKCIDTKVLNLIPEWDPRTQPYKAEELWRSKFLPYHLTLVSFVRTLTLPITIWHTVFNSERSNDKAWFREIRCGRLSVWGHVYLQESGTMIWWQD